MFFKKREAKTHVFDTSSLVYGDQARYFEMERLPKIKHKKLGCVSMINNDSDQHGSQVYIEGSSHLTQDADHLSLSIRMCL